MGSRRGAVTQSGPRFFGFGPTLIRPKPVCQVLPEPGAMKRPHHIDRVDPEARPAPRAAAFVEREARWDDTATKIKRGEARLDACQGSHFERRIVMLARVWQKTLVASVRRSSVTVTTPPEPVVAAPATQLPDGIWTVQGRAIQGTRRCGDWLGSPDQIGKVSCPVWSKDEKEPIRGGPRASM